MFLLSLVLLVLGASCTRVEYGNVGVKVDLLGTDKGVQSQVVGVGRYWIGVNEELYTFPTYQVNYTYTEDTTEGSPRNEEFTFQTKEGMACEVDLGVAMHFNVDKISSMFQKYHKGEQEIRSVVVRNEIRDALVSVTSSLPVEYVYGEGKKQIIDSVKKIVTTNLKASGIEIDNIYLIGIVRIPKTVRDALNSKVEMTQQAQKAENEVKKAEADAKIAAAQAQGRANSVLIEAKAQADANRLLNASLTDNLIRNNAIDKWNGELPTYSGGGAIPFLNIK